MPFNSSDDGSLEGSVEFDEGSAFDGELSGSEDGSSSIAESIDSTTDVSACFVSRIP